MKKIRVVLYFLSILAAFSCNSGQSKKEKQKLEKTIFTESEIKNRESIVKEMITTSPRYKQLTEGLYDVVVKNGGSSIGISLEGSPNSKPDKTISYSKTYDFTLYEMYSDRRMNTTRFSFNPENKKLYEYDAVNDTLKFIEFDNNLLLAYEGFSK